MMGDELPDGRIKYDEEHFVAPDILGKIYTIINNMDLIELYRHSCALFIFHLLMKYNAHVIFPGSCVEINETINLILFDRITGLPSQIESKLARKAKNIGLHFSVNPIYRSKTSLLLSDWGFVLADSDCQLLNSVIEKRAETNCGKNAVKDFLNEYDPFKGYIEHLHQLICKYYIMRPYVGETAEKERDDALSDLHEISEKYDLPFPTAVDDG